MTGVWEGAVNCALWASKSTRPRSHEQRQNPEGLSPLEPLLIVSHLSAAHAM